MSSSRERTPSIKYDGWQFFWGSWDLCAVHSTPRITSWPFPRSFQYLVQWSFSLSCFNLKHVSGTLLFPYCVNLLQRISVTPASAFGLSGCILACTHKTCKPMLIGFWVPFVLFETSERLHKGHSSIIITWFSSPVILGLTGWKSFKSRELIISFFQFSSLIHIILPVNSSARFSRFPSIIMILFRDGKFLSQIRYNLTNVFYEGLVYYIGRTWLLCLSTTLLRRCTSIVMMCMRYFPFFF